MAAINPAIARPRPSPLSTLSFLTAALPVDAAAEADALDSLAALAAELEAEEDALLPEPDEVVVAALELPEVAVEEESVVAAPAPVPVLDPTGVL